MVNEPKEGFVIFFEAYNRIAADTVKFLLTVRGMKGDTIWSDSMIRQTEKDKNSCFMRVESEKYSAGDYVIELKVFINNHSEDTLKREAAAHAARSFSIRWRGMPVTITNINLAIDQLQYVAEKEEIEEIKKAPAGEKQQRFFEFWKKRDPTPNTDYNELMEEYFQRVDYANRNFSHYQDGWKTDRGMVYITFGAPNNIERHPFDVDSKPYEVWTYYEINREFVFVDASGFGDYRLQNPMWDTWRTRYR
jgi:GWxTD domain-containing protein